jgi:hypothetical protein
MGTVRRFGRVRIEIRPDDHNPPHAHVLGPEGGVLVNLESLEAVGLSKARATYAEALSFIAAERDALLRLWQELNP